MLESQLEAYFRLRVRRDLRGLSYKLAPTTAGMPDRLIITRGHTHLVELKTETGALSPVQHHVHGEIRAQGVPVVVLYGKADVDSWISAQLAEAAAPSTLG